ncbi:MAG: T9SS C-terminal target domain-containing protein [Cytophagales bacterium]|nr:MAG: T9SS C-terminal target domain-containing protein [Cytophagales bacterium]
MFKTIQKLGVGMLLSAVALQTQAQSQVWHYVGGSSSDIISAGTADYQSLAMSPSGVPYVAYKDNANGNRTTVLSFNGTNWGTVGSVGFGSNFSEYRSLAISPNGVPYVAFQDFQNSSKTSVMSFDGTNWGAVGSMGISEGAASSQSLAISPSGVPFVAYQDYTTGPLGSPTYQLTVLSFNGSNWGLVGSKGVSVGAAANPSLAISSNGVPYVAYKDGANGEKTTVLSFNGTNWGTVGNAGISQARAFFQSLAISPSGVPYVAYYDEANRDKTTVLSFNGTNWGSVGSVGISEGKASYQSLAISPSGVPYVAYSDLYQFSGKTTVLSFDGTNWNIVGSERFGEEAATYQSLKINPVTGQPFVAFKGVSSGTQVQKFGECISPAIVTQPISQISCAGINVTFEVSATGDNLRYKWSNNLSNTKTMSTSFEDSYSVTIKGACGSTTSNTVTLSTLAGTGIGVQSSSQSVCGGNFVTFAISPTGSSFSYVWSNGESGRNNINTSVPGIYTATVSGTCGNAVSSDFILTTLVGTTISIQPMPQTVCGGTMTTFNISAVGANLMYAWSNGLSTTNEMITSIAGTNYNVTVLGTCGSAVSNTVSLSTLVGTGIGAQSSSQSVCGGNFVTFGISPTGSNFSYVWSNSESGRNNIYTSVPGIYTATVSGTCGSVVSNDFILTTLAGTQITTQPLSQIIQPNATANLSVSATGADLTYKWSSNETVSAISSKGPGTYTVTVSGTCGSVVSDGATIVGLTLSNATITGVSANEALNSATSITISGTGFSNMATVTVNGVALFGFSVSNGTTIIATIPAGTLSTTGNIILVQNPNQVASSNAVVAIVDVTLYVNSTLTINNLPLTIYPNPSTGTFTVKGGKSVTVYDMLGKVILSTSETTFTISAKGIFIAQVETESGVKFVKLAVE